MNQLEVDNSTIMFRAVDDNHTPPGITFNKWMKMHVDLAVEDSEILDKGDQET